MPRHPSLPQVLGRAALLMLGGVHCGPPVTPASPEAPTAGEGAPRRFQPGSEPGAAQDAVVRIVGDVSCTGTLIADDQVLTAHRCVAVHDQQGHPLRRDKPAEQLSVELGGDDLPWGGVGVRAILAPDCGYSSVDGDIAILILSRPLVGIPTHGVRLEQAPEAHDKISIVGFGRCAHSQGSMRRVTRDAGRIDSIAAGHFVGLASTCPGDVGGPVFSSKGDIIGILSAQDAAGDGRAPTPSRFTRVDTWPQLFTAARVLSRGDTEPPPYGDCQLADRSSARP
jgi:V8-like Glu-specific endopeptidase